ncbi:MAG: outer membrane beta-barrel protein [Bacteroidota bacterium]|nr:outer membrane beta-barrel protein [Bacteroidota bacterium]
MKKLITLMSLAVVSLSFAQEEEPKFNFSGSVDAYFRTNMTSGNDGGAGQAPPSSFVDTPGFSLGMANVVASYEGETVGFVADLMFGPRADAAILDGANPINQMYMYWNVNDKLTLTMGRFNTFYGYEVISTPGNFNYSMSHLFSFGPFSHNGIKADYDLGNDWSTMVAIMNPTDVTTSNPTGDYAVGFQLGYKGQYFNVLESQGTLGLDFTGGFDMTDSIFLGINAAKQTYDDGAGIDFYGVALYPQFTTSDTFSWGMRLEYFTFEDHPAFGDDISVFTPTLTANYSVGDLTIKPELRLDSASEDLFTDADGGATGALSSFVLGAVYTF